MIHTFVNKPHQNIFNQDYKYFIFEKNYTSKIKPEKLASFILKKEKQIIKNTQKSLRKLIKQDGKMVELV